MQLMNTISDNMSRKKIYIREPYYNRRKSFSMMSDDELREYYIRIRGEDNNFLRIQSIVWYLEKTNKLYILNDVGI